MASAPFERKLQDLLGSGFEITGYPFGQLVKVRQDGGLTPFASLAWESDGKKGFVHLREEEAITDSVGFRTLDYRSLYRRIAALVQEEGMRVVYKEG